MWLLQTFSFPPMLPADAFVCATAVFKTLIPSHCRVLSTSNRLCWVLGRELVILLGLSDPWLQLCTYKEEETSIKYSHTPISIHSSRWALHLHVEGFFPPCLVCWLLEEPVVTLPSVQPSGVLNERQVMLTVLHNPTSHEYFSLLAELLLCCTVCAAWSCSALEYNWWTGNERVFHIWKFSVILRDKLGKLTQCWREDCGELI